MFAARWLTSNLHGHEVDDVWRIGIPEHQLFLPNPNDLDAEFLAKFSPSCICERLAWLALTAREFPQPAVALVESALADEYFLATRNHRCDDPDHGIRTIIDDYSAFATAVSQILPNVEWRQVGDGP
jgi:hypothetical protein